MKKVTDHDAKSGQDLKKHPYEEQLDFLIEQPNIKPSYIVGSTEDGNQLSSVEENTYEDSESDIDSSQHHQHHQLQFQLRRKGLMFQRY